MRTPKPSGVITLTTDFGHKGPFVGVMKGVMLARYPDAQIVDLTHQTVVHWPAEAGFWVERSYRYFPLGTVHVAVVDPGVGTARDILAVAYDGHVFLAPDNGLLAPIAGRPGAIAHRLDVVRLAHLALPRPSLTFHGRDIFAPIAAELAKGTVAVGDLGPKTTEWVPSWVEDPEVSPGEIKGTVITVDTFGNLISNIDQRHLLGLTSPVALVAGRHLPLLSTYGQVKPGDYLALINSFGVLEIARAEQSASEGLGLERGAPIAVVERAG